MQNVNNVMMNMMNNVLSVKSFKKKLKSQLTNVFSNLSFVIDII